MIAGDLPEAHDTTDSAIVEREDGSFLVDGRVDILELSDALGCRFEEGSFHTAAGLVLNELGRFPREGQIVRIGPFDVEVIDMDERRIDKLLFRRVRNRH